MKGELKKPALRNLRLRGKKRKTENVVEKRGKTPEMTLFCKPSQAILGLYSLANNR
jgi:hypothetical protein